jgi:ribosomal protein L23
MNKHTGHIIISPRITEKGAYLSEHGAYLFNVGRDVNKKEIADAIRALYKVTPRKITVATVPSKRVVSRTSKRVGHSAKGKKAYVYLKKGESIEII